MKSALLAICLTAASALAVDVLGQTKAPSVTIDVTLPNGETKQLTARAGDQATVKMPDESEFGFRPVVRDSDSSHVDVTIIKVGTPEEHLGTVEARVGEVAVESKTTPAFKIAIVKVTPPEEG
jgi:hypothetical protein